jgi:hypothetical protein
MNPGEEVRAVEPQAWTLAGREGEALTSFTMDRTHVERMVSKHGFHAEPWVRWADYESLRARAERAEENEAGLRDTIEGLRRLVREAREQIVWGRYTDHEYKERGSPSGWTWLPHVRMWARLDQDHWDAIQRAESAERERHAANRALFQMQEAAKLLTGERDALLQELNQLRTKP